MQRKRVLSLLLLCLGVVSLAACGARQANASNAGSTVTPTTTTASGGKVTVTVGKAQYAPNATIMITITNSMAQSIAAANHQSGCTMVTLQWQDAQGTWQDQNRCRQGAMTRLITLPSHSSQVQQISPTSGIFVRSAQWAKGAYRVVFTFTLGNTTDVESIPIAGGSGSPIYSSTFVVA